MVLLHFSVLLMLVGSVCFSSVVVPNKRLGGSPGRVKYVVSGPARLSGLSGPARLSGLSYMVAPLASLPLCLSASLPLCLSLETNVI